MRRKRKSVAMRRRNEQQALAEVSASLAPKVLAELLERTRAAEVERDVMRGKFVNLRNKLVSLLTAEQLEAAQIAGCEPEIYAIEWIDMWRRKIMETAPVPYPVSMHTPPRDTGVMTGPSYDGAQRFDGSDLR